jgi:hypothetical protein
LRLAGVVVKAIISLVATNAVMVEGKVKIELKTNFKSVTLLLESNTGVI